MTYLGSWKIDDYMVFAANTHTPSTGAATDADAVPSYRIYEDETGTPIVTGDMAKLDDAGTTGFYTEQIQLTAAAGFEKGKSYNIYVYATVGGITGTLTHCFQMEAEVDANTVSATDSIVDAVWDEVLSSGTHDVNYSAGQRLRYMILAGGAAQAATDNTITLANTESSVDDIFADNIISIVAGTGAGQTRLIISYVGSSNIATVDRAWITNPTAGSLYEILPFSGVVLSHYGIAVGGASNTITLAATASGIDDTYIGSVIYIASGTGAGQARVITDYNGTSNIATVSDAWTTQPVAGSVYKVLPVGRVVVDSIKDEAITAGAIAANAIGASELAADAATEIADAVLTRDWTAVAGEAARSVLNALRFLRNKWSISGSTLTVTEEDDSTTAWTGTVTTDAAADPITANDPT